MPNDAIRSSPSPTRPARRPITLEVRRTETVARDIVRIWLGGPGFDHFNDNGSTEQYVKLLLAPPGITYAPDEDMESIRTNRPVEERPRVRTYTVRHVDHDAREMAIDFILHGDAGIAAPWAAAARPGDTISLLGPGGAWSPDLDAPWHLIAGDDAALPAIDAALRALPDDAVVFGVIDLAVPERADYLDPRFRSRLRLIGPDGPTLGEALDALDLPDGDGIGFVHAELSEIRSIRTHLLERGLTRDRLSISGYWRQGKDEDGFQAEKRAEAERERAGAA